MRFSVVSGFAVYVVVCIGACSSSDEESSPLAPDAGVASDAATRVEAAASATDAAVPGDAGADASSGDAGALAIPAAGTCTFSVDGTQYTSANGDPFTLAILRDGSLSVQCVAGVAGVRYTVGLAANGVTAPGPTRPGVGQLSEQPAGGGSPEQFRNFATTIDVVALSSSSINGRTSFVATGNMNRRVAVAFQLAL